MNRLYIIPKRNYNSMLDKNFPEQLPKKWIENSLLYQIEKETTVMGDFETSLIQINERSRNYINDSAGIRGNRNSSAGGGSGTHTCAWYVHSYGA